MVFSVAHVRCMCVVWWFVFARPLFLSALVHRQISRILRYVNNVDNCMSIVGNQWENTLLCL